MSTVVRTCDEKDDTGLERAAILPDAREEGILQGNGIGARSL
jgi:hypothetical protein